ncbi:tetratricopeptide repeat protein [candidate division KSB1 bacterium]
MNIYISFRHFSRFIMFLMIGLFVFTGHSFSQTAQEWFDRGVKYKEEGKIDDAIKAFDKAKGKDRNFSEAYYEMALLYQIKESPASLKRATDALLEAMRIETDNAKYKYALGEVYYDRTMYEDSKKMFERALEIDPDYIPALNGFARCHTREFRQNKDRVSYDPDGMAGINEAVFITSSGVAITNPGLWDKNLIRYVNENGAEKILEKDFDLINSKIPELRFDRFTAVNDSIASAVFDHILELDPDDYNTQFDKGLLYYEKNSFEQFKDLFENLVEKNPIDKDANLILGLAYFRNKEYEKAVNQFDTAKGLMSPDELDIFTNVGHLKVGGLKEKKIRNSEEDTTLFWYQRDPLYLTSFNEREMAHYCRVAEANLLFSVKRLDIEGWNTTQGKTLIKYGKPKNRKVHWDLNVRTRGTFNRANLKHDFWYYDDFSFVFETQVTDYYDRYKYSYFGILDFPRISGNIEKDFPEYYKYESRGEFIDVPFDIATFKGINNKTKVEVYYALPLNKFSYNKVEETLEGSYRYGIFLHNENWERIFTDIQTDNIILEQTEIDTSSDEVTIEQMTYFIDEGKYNFAFEIQDQLSENEGTFRDELTVPEYSSENLEISDFVLALDIERLNFDVNSAKENLGVTPNPTRTFRLDQPLFIYYEIYNLFLNAEPGNSDFSIEYNIRYMQEDRPWLVDFVRNLVLNSEQDFGVTTSVSNRGRNKDEFQFIRIDHNIEKPGQYLLQIKVTDNISKKEVEKTVNFSFVKGEGSK